MTRSQKQRSKSLKPKLAGQERNLTSEEVRKFQNVIYRYYRKHRRNLPWRLTLNSYHILVSEIMLQQTQVQRVMGKYEQFTRKFPGFPSLASAPLRLILKEWLGLGYNRRALALKRIAQKVMKEFCGNLPASVETLITFPGIGRATASSIAAFAFHEPTVFIETNIRRVFIHSFFHDTSNIKDTEILPLVEKTLDTSNPREWYYALMDYGVMLKKEYENPNRRSAHYQKQSPFHGSDRQVRGMLIKILTRQSCVSEREIMEKLQISSDKLKNNLAQLLKEGFIKRRREKYTIA
ncbi:MAG: A/G-specific adenine glycosylase [Planctomycetes bacterium]|nr:A/G-specific adenine glycosylase [Planctomycetota bacterium]